MSPLYSECFIHMSGFYFKVLCVELLIVISSTLLIFNYFCQIAVVEHAVYSKFLLSVGGFFLKSQLLYWPRHPGLQNLLY